MRVALLFPPATDPRSPHLSLASLAAHLRASGVEVDLHDLDVSGLHWMLARDRLEHAAASFQDHHDRLPVAERRELAHLAGLAPWIADNASRALDEVRDLAAFLDPDRLHDARRTISAALRLVSGATGGQVTYAINSAAYDVAGCDPAKLADLVRVTADPSLDLFHDHTTSILVPSLARDRPDVVGISILNRQQVLPGLFLARRLKAAGHVVVLGGTVYAKFHEALRERPTFFETFCHALVPYEGETAMLALVEALDSGASLHDLGAVPNLLSLDRRGHVVAGPTHVEDVRRLPTPDFTGLPLDLYLNPVPVLPILTGKGCYFNRCKFCDIPFINSIASKPYRVRDPDQIAADVATLHRRHGARHFEITDETLSPKLLRNLADALDDHPGLDPRFVGYARLEPGFTPDTCERIHEMGMRKLFFGLESANQAVLDHMDKGIDVGVARDVLANCVRSGIAVHVFSIVGFPEESEAQARDTLAFLLDERATLAAPMNTFDVHPFGLDLRTDYGDHPERYGVQVDRSQLDGADFPITLMGWRNTRGIDHDLTAKLLEEFTAELHRAYFGPRAYPDQQWPGFEEYAVVYGDHHEPAAFPFRLALPDRGSHQRFTLRWADHVQVGAVPDGEDHEVVVRSLAGDAIHHGVIVTLLSRAPEATTTDELLDFLASHVVADGGAAEGGDAGEGGGDWRGTLQAVVDSLVSTRALWLRPTP